MPPKKINKPKTIRKTVLLNPNPVIWPEITPHEENEIMDEIIKVTAVTVENEKKVIKVEGIEVGFNVVNKLLERDKLCAVLICYMGKTLHINEKLIPFCEAKRVPIVAMKNKIDDLLKSFRMNSILALGIQKEYANQHKNLVQLITKFSKPQIKLVEPERREIPPPPDIEFPDNSDIKTSANQCQDNHMDYIRLDSNMAFPQPEYPPELDNLQIKILNPGICDKILKLEPHKRKFENNQNNNSNFQNKQPKLKEINLKHTFHTPNEKKREKKLRRKKNAKNLKNIDNATIKT